MNNSTDNLMYHKMSGFWIAFLGQICLAVILFVIGMMVIFNTFYVVTPVSGKSMVPTLNDNDTMYVNKREPYTHGDIIVANEPRDGVLVVKRVIAMEGDAIDICFNEIDGYFIELNGTKLAEPYINDEKGLKSTYDNFVALRERVKKYKTEGYLIDESTLTDEEKIVLAEDKRLADTCKFQGDRLILQGGQLFVLGDNRGVSLDSSTYGPFRYDDVWGRVEYVENNGYAAFAYFAKRLLLG